MSAKILIVAEPDSDGGLHGTFGELIAAARKLAADGEVAVLAPVGNLNDDSGLSLLDADVIYRVSDASVTADYSSGIYDAVTAAVATLAAQLESEIVLLSKSDLGSVAGPRVAARLGGAFAADCVDVTLNLSGQVAVTRPVHGGNAMAVYEFQPDAPQVVSIRPGAFEPAPMRSDGTAKFEDFDFGDAGGHTSGATLLESVQEEVAGVPLESADIVVAGGRGLGGPEPFEELGSLCDILGAALGASRAACDAGWIDHSHQVGLTGKKISPKTYITVGISGASQHMAGCSSARNIVAINRDASSNIFSHARFGVVGDWAQVLPAFIAACAELRSNA